MGKTSWLGENYPGALRFDLLSDEIYLALKSDPGRLAAQIPPGHKDWIILDEVQRVPEVLNEVHRLIESRKLKFVLTGSSARKLRRGGANLLAGRAYTEHMYPLTAKEMGAAFDLQRALRFGCLPGAVNGESPEAFLKSYVSTYLREEVQQEGLTRNVAAFARFLEAASFSQAQPLSISAVSRECAVERKVVEDYFQILEDLLIAVRLPVFTRKAKRKLATHPKFLYFDAGVYRAVRPRGPLDAEAEIDGPALETLVFQELRALNSYLRWDYSIFTWRTSIAPILEVDLVLYGERGLHAIEVKRSDRVRPEDLRGLKAFKKDYAPAKLWLYYLGNRRYHEDGVEILPLRECIGSFDELFS